MTKTGQTNSEFKDRFSIFSWKKKCHTCNKVPNKYIKKNKKQTNKQKMTKTELHRQLVVVLPKLDYAGSCEMTKTELYRDL